MKIMRSERPILYFLYLHLPWGLKPTLFGLNFFGVFTTFLQINTMGRWRVPLPFFLHHYLYFQMMADTSSGITVTKTKNRVCACLVLICGREIRKIGRQVQWGLIISKANFVTLRERERGAGACLKWSTSLYLWVCVVLKIPALV